MHTQATKWAWLVGLSGAGRSIELEPDPRRLVLLAAGSPAERAGPAVQQAVYLVPPSSYPPQCPLHLLPSPYPLPLTTYLTQHPLLTANV